jgi:hypothetical protein
VPTRLVLDYFHVAMKVRHAEQCIGRIPSYRFFPNGSPSERYDRGYPSNRNGSLSISVISVQSVSN